MLEGVCMVGPSGDVSPPFRGTFLLASNPYTPVQEEDASANPLTKSEGRATVAQL